MDTVKKLRLCFNCIHPKCSRSQNWQQPCDDSRRCRHYSSSHHSMLCKSPQTGGRTTSNNGQKSESSQTSSSDSPSTLATGLVSVAAVADGNAMLPTVLLGSALIQVKGGNGQFYTLRGIIDSAASSSFITEAAAHKIGLCYERTVSADPVSGIGGAQVFSGIKGRTTCLVKPKNASAPVLPTDTVIIKTIVTELPCARVSGDVKSHYSALKLADDQFHIPQKVDFLVGADVFPYVYTGEKWFGPDGVPPALNSIFGWVITGKVGHGSSTSPDQTALITAPVSNAILRKFWELEEIPRKIPVHPDDLKAEKMFQEKHYQLPDGRYVVPLLLREQSPPLGESKTAASNRLIGIERRLNKDPPLKKAYADFLDEYEKLGHMSKVRPENSGKAQYYIPHHCVVRDDNPQKIRVVFDGSQKSSSGASLNNVLYAGPKLQREIFDVILKFRVHRMVFACDISKMYRQILIIPENRQFQHILMSNGKVTEYELNTVTYGLTSSPFLALRTVEQLKQDEGHKYPLGASAANEDRFVDDICTGSHDTPSLLHLQDEIVNFLKLGGFEVQKWASNCPEVLSRVPPEHRLTSLNLIDENSLTKLLGIHWNAQADCFFYVIKITPHKATKRNILSQIAKIFDPMGYLSPIVLKAKIFMRKLWLEGLDWDAPVPAVLKNEWSQFYEKLPAIGSLKINRCITLTGAHLYYLVGFCDASAEAYCSSVYLCVKSDLEIKVSLLCSKSRVAPTKTVSIPRLELCAAKLLSSLVAHVKTQLSGKLELENVANFTDSEVVLAWIRTVPCQLKSFEANRVTSILENTEPSSWKYVPSDQNPADLGSRGCAPDQLENDSLWWNGPSWLGEPVESWKNASTNDSIPCKKGLTAVTLLVASNFSFWESLIAKYSSLVKLQRIVAWLLRYFNNLTKAPEDRIRIKTLTVKEIDESLNFLIKIVQKKHFLSEIHTLRITGEVPGHMHSLQPFIDAQGLLRVGGRLRNSNLPYDAVHPLLLPKNERLVNMIIDEYHERYAHAGPRLLHSLLARNFWIISARAIIRLRLKRCFSCFRVRPTNSTPLMGDLPAARVTPSKAFTTAGVDYAGPFLIREHKRRNPKLAKAWLSVFCCLSTKAVHLEIVSDLTTDAFLAAFDRMVSRRGLCKKVYSDNGTNFTGANNHLTELFDYLKTQKQIIDEKLVNRGIEWTFCPPNGPHFNGLMEAGVKSAKTHLKRIIGTQTLTFEELTTIFSKIEAIMNSRPLCSLSSDVSETDVLTPGHFLIGTPLVAVPEYDVTDIKQNRLSQWQLIQQFTQQFWKSWSRDYLHTLIQRSKWFSNKNNVKIGDIVLIADDDTAPTHWKKGIVEEVFPGKDSIVRVVKVRTASGTLRRPAVKIYPLPLE